MSVFSKNIADDIIEQSKYGSAEYISSANPSEINDIHLLLTNSFRGKLDNSDGVTLKKGLIELKKDVTNYINSYRN